MPTLRELLTRAGLDAVNHKRYQVSFLAAKPKPEAVRKLEAAAVPPERLVVSGREVYAWHPDGVGRPDCGRCSRGGIWE
jgi:hypothetical protein